MTIRAVIGGQWGDEGKGKIVDFLSDEADVVVRFNGADNAGHTVVRDGKKYKLHLIPSGILSKAKCIIAPGVACNPKSLSDEIKNLRNMKATVSPENLFISERTHILRPYNIFIESIKSVASNNIGTTGRGVGPCYSDKINREGIRYCDNDETIKKRIDEDLKTLRKASPSDAKLKEAVEFAISATEHLPEYIAFLRPFVRDVFEVYEQLSNGNGVESLEILLEGAQGALLDIDYGTYPYVTSSNIINFASAGIDQRKVREIIGVMKAYATRVGGGPFPTEQNNELGDLLRKNGIEFGTTTERPRRCGWFDASAAQYAMRFCHFDSLAITKLDVLTGINPIKICVGYELDGNRLKSFPANADDLKKVTPIYIDMPGWKEFPQKIESLNDLPKEAVIYLNKISELLEDLPIKYVSYSPETKGTLVLKDFSYFQPGRVFH